MRYKFVVACVLLFAMLAFADGQVGVCVVGAGGPCNCPEYTPPAPSWCKDGIVQQGGTDANGCQQPPTCLPKPADNQPCPTTDFYYYQELNCVGNCTLVNSIHVTDTTTVIHQNSYYGGGGLTEWDFALLINNAMNNLDGRGISTPESRMIANALASHFVMQGQFNYTMNDVYSQLQNIEIREMIIEKAVNMTNPTLFCEAKKQVLTELGLIYIKCDNAIYWYNGIKVNMSPEFPVAVKIVTPDNTANVIMNGMEEIDITNSTMKSLTVEIGNKGNVTETAVISLEIPSTESPYPENFTLTLAPRQLTAVAFLLRRNLGEECISDQDCRIGSCVNSICTLPPAPETNITQTEWKTISINETLPPMDWGNWTGNGTPLTPNPNDSYIPVSVDTSPTPPNQKPLGPEQPINLLAPLSIVLAFLATKNLPFINLI